MATQKQLDVLKSIEHHVATFIDDKMNLPKESWQPSDFLPDFSESDFPDTIKSLQDRMSNLPDTVLVSLIGNMITEEALPSYQTYFNLLHGVNEKETWQVQPHGRDGQDYGLQKKIAMVICSTNIYI
jgi:acyl-[acyl-carrier-protein] desaturase